MKKRILEKYNFLLIANKLSFKFDFNLDDHR